MPGKKVSKPPSDPIARCEAALAGAQAALKDGQAGEAERIGKAVLAIKKAFEEIEDWKRSARASSPAAARHAGAAARRKLELLFNRARAEEGLDPLFDEPDRPATKDPE